MIRKSMDSVNSPKRFPCPQINCNKSYNTMNGLKYHTTHGTCRIEPAIPVNRTETLAGRTLKPIQQLATPTSTSRESEAISSAILQSLDRSAQLPFACGIDGCPRRYKNILGLKYHYQTSGEHGAIGLERLKNGQYKQVTIAKTDSDDLGESSIDGLERALSTPLELLQQIIEKPSLVSEHFGKDPAIGKQIVLAAVNWRSVTLTEHNENEIFVLQAQRQKLEYEVARLIQSHITTVTGRRPTMKPTKEQPQLRGMAGGLTTSLTTFSLNSPNDPSNLAAMNAGIPLPEAVEYLDLVRLEFSTSETEWNVFRSAFDDWAKDRTYSRDCHTINAYIFRIIDAIRSKACLIEPLNNLLFPGQKLECPNIPGKVKYFVFAESSMSGIKIHSTSGYPLPFPSSDFDLRWITKADVLQRNSYFTRKYTDIAWLLCVSRVLQLMLDGNFELQFPLDGEEREVLEELADVISRPVMEAGVSFHRVESFKDTSITPKAKRDASPRPSASGNSSKTSVANTFSSSAVQEEIGGRPATPLLFALDDDFDDSTADDLGSRFSGQLTKTEVNQDEHHVRQLFEWPSDRSDDTDPLPETSPSSSLSSRHSTHSVSSANLNDPTLNPNWRLAISRLGRRPQDIFKGNLSYLIHARRKAVIGSTSTSGSSNCSWPNFNSSVSDGSLPSI